ncbi:MAG: hypothetical protein E6312_02075 [Peptoniphilus grossensis]|uniref:hypothetical protein n=1 Tax=Peptoniphilus grossensis TaxID=1465756 RepID=UPI00290AF661|nr:hypothetical protein [Peptoniphilus grossensis]MDU7150838.1 hypothetical protein [Peptoniphilus grossensis]
MIYKRILKIIISHAALIFYWSYLYKTGEITGRDPIINLTSAGLILIIYGFIYTEITKKEDKKTDGLYIFASLLFFALALNKNLHFLICLGLGLLTSIFYIVKNLRKEKTFYISILPISKKMTQVFTGIFICVIMLLTYLLDLDVLVINIFNQVIFFACCLFFFLFLKDREDVYDKTFKLFYISQYLANERENFARLIHDEVLQDIFAAKNYLSLKEPKVHEASDLLTKLNERLRKIMKFYQTSLFEDFGMEENIHGIFENVASLYPYKTPKIDKKISSALENLRGEEVKLIALITKELVNNIYKHSEATYIFYRLYEDRGFIIMEVESDGMAEGDFKNIEDSKRGVLLLKMLISSNEGEISYEDRGRTLYTKIRLRRFIDENSFIR